ncbi:formate/nitrite transporter family protein [Amycolatopsis sp. CA-128772]|uniref:formate/nitrite transporter family protein n=1 Tax=Amycolatopsis sp. CA-128772 TaxID=2073159 RepID=UPI000CD06C8C|nr:formate/nitrite transporter family protein [Amycolatopsis sp. CA-128772]
MLPALPGLPQRVNRIALGHPPADDRLGRPLLPLAATGLLGGVDVAVDVAVGVLAYLVVEHETGQPLLASAAFTIGFIALLLARSELFTEKFLVPVTALASGSTRLDHHVRRLAERLGALHPGRLGRGFGVVVPGRHPGRHWPGHLDPAPPGCPTKSKRRTTTPAKEACRLSSSTSPAVVAAFRPASAIPAAPR